MAKDKSTRIVYIALVVSRIVIWLWVWYVFFSGNAQEKTANNWTGEEILNSDQKSRYYIDQAVILDGEISKNQEFGLYSHALKTSDGKTFWLKSADTDLNTFSGNVSIKWAVSDIQDEMVIIKVEEIVTKSVGDIDTNTGGEWDKSAYFYQEEGLLIDLGPTEGFALQERWEDIEILEVGSWEPKVVLWINSFECNTSNSLTDCESLQQNFKNIKADSFISSNGINFSNLTETNTWLAFDWEGRGYYIKPSEENNLVSFVDLISFINPARVKTLIGNKVNATCKNLDASIWDGWEVALDSSNQWTLVATVRGEDTQSQYLFSCIYQATLWTGMKFEHRDTQVRNNPAFVPEEIIEEVEEEEEEEIDQEIDEVPEVEDTEEVPEEAEVEEEKNEEIIEEEENGDAEVASGDLVEIEEEAEEDDENTAEIVDEGEYAGQLSFTSARGYTMYFSDKGIGYAWSYLSEGESLTIWAANCSYGVKVIAWKDIDSVQGSPDSIIYECAWTLDLAAIPEGVTYITEQGGKHFVKKDISDKYVGMEVGIVSQ